MHTVVLSGCAKTGRTIPLSVLQNFPAGTQASTPESKGIVTKFSLSATVS
jgi:hypothetical protein